MAPTRFVSPTNIHQICTKHPSFGSLTQHANLIGKAQKKL
jgi:hypothetical protein